MEVKPHDHHMSCSFVSRSCTSAARASGVMSAIGAGSSFRCSSTAHSRARTSCKGAERLEHMDAC